MPPVLRALELEDAASDGDEELVGSDGEPDVSEGEEEDTPCAVMLT